MIAVISKIVSILHKFVLTLTRLFRMGRVLGLV